MNQKQTFLSGAVYAGLAVIIGAFGAHALKPILIKMGRVDTFELAVRYQFYHALALLINGLLMFHFTARSLKIAAICFNVGIIIFSGSLYLLCITNQGILGAITPLGGVSFIAGWIFLFFAIYNKK